MIPGSGRRCPGESLDEFKERNCMRFAIAFREQAASLEAQGRADLAEALRVTARVAERAAGLSRFRSAELRRGSKVN